MEFNNKLYELRKQKGFSQEELANRLNVSRQTISKWEVGESTPDMEKLFYQNALTYGFKKGIIYLHEKTNTFYTGCVVRHGSNFLYRQKEQTTS